MKFLLTPWDAQCHQSGLICQRRMTSLNSSSSSVRFIVEPESILNIPNQIGAECIVVGENASIAIEVLEAHGRDVWIFGVSCLQDDGSEHPAFRVTKVCTLYNFLDKYMNTCANIFSMINVLWQQNAQLTVFTS